MFERNTIDAEKIKPKQGIQPPLVEVINVTKSFGGFTALENINLMFKSGEIHCLAGENGSGKSTLVKIVSGIYTPDSGTILINGKSYSHTTPALSMKEGIQIIYQDLSLFNHMSVAENICYWANYGKTVLNRLIGKK